MPVTPSQNTDSYKSEAYTKHALENQYTLQPGVFVLPVAEEPPTNPEELANWSPVVTVQAHAPYRVRNVQFATKKTGSPPVIPSPQNTGVFTFVGGTIAFPSPTITSDGMGFHWEVYGQYAFVEDARSAPEDGFVLGSDPIPNGIYLQLRQLYQDGNPQTGAAAEAGDEVRVAYAEAADCSLENPNYTYWSQSYFPGTFFNTGMLNGETTSPGVQG